MITMRKTRIIGALAVIAMLVIACTPEIKFQKNLTKDGGRWNMDEIRVNTSVQLDPPVNSEYVADNQGELLFYESGTGIWIALDTTTNLDVANYFEYENTANSILINFENSLEQEFSVQEVSKDEQIWTREEAITDPVTNIVTNISTQITISRVNEISNK